MAPSSSKPLDILILGNLAPFRIGGAEVQARLLAQYLARRGHRICVAGYANPHAQLEVESDAQGSGRVRTHRLPTIRSSRLTRGLTYLISLGWFLIRHRRQFDVIVCFMMGESDIVAALLKRYHLLRAPILVCTASHGSTGDAQRLRRLPCSSFIIRLIQNHCAAVNIISPRIATELADLGFNPSQLLHIPYGVDLKKCEGNPGRFAQESRTFLFVGRLIPLKGVAELIQAVQILSHKGVRIKLDIAGYGPLASELHEQVEALGLQDRIAFLGTIPPEQIQATYGDHAILVLPSHREAFGMVVAEAMTCAMPVVVTRSGGPEFIVDESAGRICPPRDPEALADAMEALAALSEEQLARMGQAGRRHVSEHFAMGKIADRYIEVFYRLIQGGGALTELWRGRP